MKIIKKLIPFVVLIVLVGIAVAIFYTPPQTKKRGSRPAPSMIIEKQTINQAPYQVTLQSFGKVTAKHQGQLTAQVSGQIVAVSPAFNEGSFFKKGEVLVSIDPRDYLIRVESAQAELAQAQVAYDEEVARSAQAIKDRNTLGSLNEASDFALRKPQMAAAKAKLMAASANMKQAKLDVERTRIIAPYDGRLLTKNADIGQVINSNTNLASIFSTEVAEVRLPIKNSQLALIDLPNNHQSQQQVNDSSVSIINTIGGEAQYWPSTIARTSGSIDQNTQQINIISEVLRPFDAADKRSLNIGQFVNATISGRTIADAIVIPNSTIYQGSYVYLYQDGKLQRRDIEIGFQNESDALVTSGLSAGEDLVTTPLGQVSSGTAVQLKGSKKSTRRPQNRAGGNNQKPAPTQRESKTQEQRP
ncbi:efflux RND transporter periplasmic adaptor subunit [Psychrobium sp. 1_MG-2023]|uniref:efflux RND transporter periplasmic adaptor subunit n=1 Tax=Psychrobium sp. 1_MG-2023 TaxID=3062624 RepID=UPI000C33C4FD|nr:efflux RND transporter periplasmic adaptor subunit [Psychrobium sp. 1_MG-2023]MDP2562699.1 efflux RND transporter periplasmic adaptor subunit [Psychrobium sp. 1_MG-2023]PKF54788.1 efflux transporter periplasmic adaptor subunit [Alteromonadales bacterium alter-6D02]